MLKSTYLLAKIGTDTAENEQHFAEILPKTGNYPTGPVAGGDGARRGHRARRGGAGSKEKKRRLNGPPPRSFPRRAAASDAAPP